MGDNGAEPPAYLVCGWDEWQSYRKDRGQPPWIKLHRRLLRNSKWVQLSDAERGQLVTLWLLAADHEGQIHADIGMVQRLGHLNSKININKFIELGFVQPLDANLTPMGRQHDTPVQSSSEVGQSRLDKNNNIQKPDDVTEETWGDFLELRKGKKAVVTITALKRLRSEGEKAGKTLQEVMEICCQNGWQGFQERYVLNQRNQEDRYA